MKHPTKEQVLKVADVLQEVIYKYPKAQLAMGQGMVCTDNECETPHCHAGWYMIGKGMKQDFYNYSHGAAEMAFDLGLIKELPIYTYANDYMASDLLAKWAQDNPKIWGNCHGFSIVSKETAFTPKGKKQADNLQDIVDHWREVAERLGELEAKNGMHDRLETLKQKTVKQVREYIIMGSNLPTETTGKELVENLN